MSETQERHRLRREHRCYLCHREIAWGAALYAAHLEIYLCTKSDPHSDPASWPEDACARALHRRGIERDYSRSPRGRWRPVAEVRALLRARRLAFDEDRIA